MEQTVYGDLLFLVNFCMDFQCVFLVSKLLRRPFPLRRALIASVLGAFYACAALFLPFGGGVAFFLDLFVCALMCGIVFLPQEEKKWRFLIPFALYFGVSAAIGGLMSAVATLFSRLGVQGSGDTGHSSFSFSASKKKEKELCPVSPLPCTPRRENSVATALIKPPMAADTPK